MKNQFLAELGDAGFQVGDFKRRGWQSLLCGAAIREFASSQLGWSSTDETTFYNENGIDLAELKAANAEIEKSNLYKRKLYDADSAISGRENVDLDKVVKQFF